MVEISCESFRSPTHCGQVVILRSVAIFRNRLILVRAFSTFRIAAFPFILGEPNPDLGHKLIARFTTRRLWYFIRVIHFYSFVRCGLTVCFTCGGWVQVTSLRTVNLRG
jgi:hypothetical protein